MHDGEDTFIGQDANYFEGDVEARSEARRYLMEAAADVIRKSVVRRSLSVIVRDDERLISRLSLSFVEDLPGLPPRD